jgi:spermidine/putrescine transport system permease protein
LSSQPSQVDQAGSRSRAAGRPTIDRAGLWANRAFRGQAIILYLFLYVPIALVLLFSFNAGERTGELRGLSLRWYARAFSDDFALGALGNSFIVGIWTSLIATTLGTIAGLAVSRAARPVRVALEALTYIAIIIPGIVIGIATLIFYVNFFGWFNQWLAYIWRSLALGAPPIIQSGLHTIIGAHVVFTMAIVFVLIRARLAGMDRSLVEASADLYATPWRTLRQVTIPQLRPAILAGALLSFTFSFDDYIIASFVQGPGQPTLPLFVFGSIRRGLTPQVNAIASIILAITLTVLSVAYVVYRRSANQSMAASGATGG